MVRDAVRALRGTVAVESTPGKGTSFIFRLPLTLALIDGLLVETAGGKYVVPLAQVEECVALNGTRSALAEGRPCVAVRGELVPMVSLRNLFRTDGPLPAAARITPDATCRPAGRRRRRPAPGPRPGGHPVPGRGPARRQPLLRSHHPGRWLRLADPRSVSPGVRITIRRAECTFHALGRWEGGEFPMRLTLRKQITTALVLFGLVPASIVATFAFLSNEEFKDKQNVLIRAGVASASASSSSICSPRTSRRKDRRRPA